MWVPLLLIAGIAWFVGSYLKENRLTREIPVVIVLFLLSIAFMVYYNQGKFEVSIAGAVMNLLGVSR